MARTRFYSDLALAVGNTIRGVSQIVRGHEDGEIDIVFTFASLYESVKIRIIATDLSSYPADNAYFVFTDSGESAPEVQDALVRLQDFARGCTILELLTIISVELSKIELQETSFVVHDSDSEVLSNESDDWDDRFGLDIDEPTGSPSDSMTLEENAKRLYSRLKEDLKVAHFRGFNVGIVMGQHAGSQSIVLSVAIRVNRLSLSEEALEAWDLKAHQYLILLIAYSAGYKAFDAILHDPADTHEIKFRLGVGDRYKPALEDALAALTMATTCTQQATSVDATTENLGNDQSKSTFQQIFVSRSMNEFMNHHLLSFLKLQVGKCTKEVVANRQSDNNKHAYVQSAGFNEKRQCSKDAEFDKGTLPPSLSVEYMQDVSLGQESLPYECAQLMFKRLISCTAFCLVCHEVTGNGFEALKPFVCSQPLCLYQYMSLGFGGPSVERAVIKQPFVVDLLVSFCYEAARTQQLREYPDGMALMIPPVHDRSPVLKYTVSQNMATSTVTPTTTMGMKTPRCSEPVPSKDHGWPSQAKFVSNKNELILEGEEKTNIRNGDWVVVIKSAEPPTHYRIKEYLHPTITLWPPGVVRRTPLDVPASKISKSTHQKQTHDAACSVTLQFYSKNFENLSELDKCESILMLLDTLPPVTKIKALLQERQGSVEPSLAALHDIISPSAIGLLRWIVGSNRSYIMQTDRFGDDDDDADPAAKLRFDQKVSNMDGWLQFRFAQGAPDKEQRFRKAMESSQSIATTLYPSLFAFHGSPLCNWHSIIRAGLDYRQTTHGRVFGHGCYHSTNYTTSSSYSGAALQKAAGWPSSALNISGAICLNEIVNRPQEFISQSPHLVVQHVDWIQCRYLFVMASPDSSETSFVQKSSLLVTNDGIKRPEIEQDPAFPVTGVKGQLIGIPLSAFPARQCRDQTISTHAVSPAPQLKKLRTARTTGGLVDWSATDTIHENVEDQEDLAFLFSNMENLSPAKNDQDHQASATSAGEWSSTSQSDCSGLGIGVRKRKIHSPVRLDKAFPTTCAARDLITDFVPGSLDHSTLTTMSSPMYATTQATKSLSRELKAVLHLQKDIPLHELGWYIDADHTCNVYNWIVEFHSFDLADPLGKDMKAANISSVVMEIRFGKDYPYSPPFFRVIRPRFRTFGEGGGGNITAGGALCMELLTSTGWSAVLSMESVFLQVRLAITSTDPRPARLLSNSNMAKQDYTVQEAMVAYTRACRAHGWEIPTGFADLALA